MKQHLVVASNEMFPNVSTLNQRWLVSYLAAWIAYKNETQNKKGNYYFSNHGSQELGKGLEKKILKAAGFKK